jgi:hypothetical protein
MKIWLFIIFFIQITGCSVVSVFADSASNSLSLSLPNMGNNYQSDSFRAGELDCSMALGSATNLSVGLTSLIQGGTIESRKKTGDIGVFATLTIPLGRRNKGSRIDCNRLYELELKLKQLELTRLQQEIDRLRELGNDLSFED